MSPRSVYTSEAGALTLADNVKSIIHIYHDDLDLEYFETDDTQSSIDIELQYQLKMITLWIYMSIPLTMMSRGESPSSAVARRHNDEKSLVDLFDADYFLNLALALDVDYPKSLDESLNNECGVR
ncbi:11948_t:CDS:2 [Entrophospora sp. SA101]|nr:11948_t:CDS:2 [Entrophospora sp. SA101]